MKKSLMVVAALMLMSGFGCSKKHDDNPVAALDLTAPPTVSAFVVALVGGTGTTVNFDWEVSDPSNVDHYNLYQFLVTLQGEAHILLDQPTTNFVHDVDLSAYGPGIVFAVSAVTSQNVEGERVYYMTE